METLDSSSISLISFAISNCLGSMFILPDSSREILRKPVIILVILIICLSALFNTFKRKGSCAFVCNTSANIIAAATLHLSALLGYLLKFSRVV
jgi:hypothetical protein